MKNENIKNTPEELSKLITKGLSNTDTSILRDVVDELMLKSYKEEKIFSESVKELIEGAFNASINISGLQELKFKYEAKGLKKQKRKANLTAPIKAKLDSKGALRKLVTAIPKMGNLKNHFIIELSTDLTSEYQCLVLYDTNYFINPFKKAVEEKVENVVFQEIRKAKEYFQKSEFKNYVSVILLSPRINDEVYNLENINYLKDLIINFETFYYISLRAYQGSINHEKNTDRDVFLSDLKYISGQFLANSDLNFEEEKAIKKLFGLYEFPVLDYKILKGGKSGAKVIEITPKRRLADNMGKKYVIKIARDKQKIEEEARSFNVNVGDIEGLGNKYKLYSSSTTNMSSIMYEYASKQKHVKSHPLSEIIENEKHPFHPRLKAILEDLFNEQCFTAWKSDFRNERQSVRNLYSDYINLDKTIDSIAKIENESREAIMTSEFIKNFNELMDTEISIMTKVCHGDLHTANILIEEQSEEKYLIDFAFTSIRHALIDHATLECSLKFNHIPRFIDINELLEIEKEFLHADSFYPTFKIKNTARLDLINTYTLINLIRAESADYIENKLSRLEYFISLLLITFRQINYSDLNQLFALKSAKLLLKHINNNLDELAG